MRNVFLIDSENYCPPITDYYKLDKSDIVVFFYSQATDVKRFVDFFSKNKDKVGCKVILHECSMKHHVKNACDFQISACAGMYAVTHPKHTIIVISRDEGYRAVAQYLKTVGVTVLLESKLVKGKTKKSRSTVIKEVLCNDNTYRQCMCCLSVNSKLDVYRNSYNTMLTQILSKGDCVNRSVVVEAVNKEFSNIKWKQRIKMTNYLARILGVK